uniref:Uncharacterized protein n=1 Tax=Anguilla anguilla TaxID=7936 RepID=A0A0E9SY44_ANGAN
MSHVDVFLPKIHDHAGLSLHDIYLAVDNVQV